MNPVLILTHNNLELTKRCVGSLHNQNVPNEICIIDNGSRDGTQEWLKTYRTLFQGMIFPENRGVSAGWNQGLRYFFDLGYPHVLVLGNDTVLASDTYDYLYRISERMRLPFVTGVAVDNMDQAMEVPACLPITDNPDFSLFLMQRECWEKVGPFDERMKHYCSDCDYHIRAHRLGIRLAKASIPFYHERSSTLRLAPPEEQREIQEQANKDREVFKSLYGCLPGSQEYEAIFR